MWQVGPAGRARMSTASPSQSSSMPIRPRACCRSSRPCATACPANASGSAPRRSRASPSSASASCQPTMSTRPSAASWTTAATRPSGAVPDRRRVERARRAVMRRSATSRTGTPAAAMSRLDRRDRVDVAMEDRGREDRVRVPLGDGRDHVRGRAGATRGDDRHVHRATSRRAAAARSKPPGGAVAVDRGQQHLAGAQLDGSVDPLDGVEAGGLAAALDDDLPLARAGRAARAHRPR